MLCGSGVPRPRPRPLRCVDCALRLALVSAQFIVQHVGTSSLVRIPTWQEVAEAAAPVTPQAQPVRSKAQLDDPGQVMHYLQL